MSWTTDTKSPAYSPAVPTMAYQQQPLQMQQTGMQQPAAFATPQQQQMMMLQQQQQQQQAMQGMNGMGGMNGMNGMGGAQGMQMSMLHNQCAQGRHAFKVKYGYTGIAVAILCFPCGILAMLSDKEEVCTRCGFNPF